MTAAISGLCMEMANRYRISTSDMLMLWEGMRNNTDEAKRTGFMDGFKLAQAIIGGSGAAVVREADPETVPEDIPVSQTIPDPYDEQAFVRMEQSKNGKRLHFNKAAGYMFGEYRKADIYVKNGVLFIYPTNDGAYTVSRTASSGHVQICCADILDELVTKSGNYQVEKRDNHIIARASIR